MKTMSKLLLWSVFLISGEIMIGDVSREVDGEADAHDEDYHADHIKVDVPEGHDAQHSHLHRDHGEDDPDDADLAGDEDQYDNGHDANTETNTVESLIEHFSELIENVEEGIEQDHLKWQLLHH